MANSIKSYRFRLLVVFICPLLVIIGISIATIGAFLDSPVVLRFGMRSLFGGLFLMFPLGITCAVLSWRMSRTQPATASDSRDLVEFLLGFGAVVMTMLGAILSPLLPWFFAELF